MSKRKQNGRKRGKKSCNARKKSHSQTTRACGGPKNDELQQSKSNADDGSFPEISPAEAKAFLDGLKMKHVSVDLHYPGWSLADVCLAFKAANDLDPDGTPLRPILCLDRQSRVWLFLFNASRQSHDVRFSEFVFDDIAMALDLRESGYSDSLPEGVTVTHERLRLGGDIVTMESEILRGLRMPIEGQEVLSVDLLREKSVLVEVEMEVDGVSHDETCFVVFDEAPNA